MVSYFTFDTIGDESNFQNEISNMMHGFGDNPNPDAATVKLVESTVLQQLRMMLHEASGNATMRGDSTISNYDIIFLMRKNPIKLKRLYDYQEKLDAIDESRQATANISDLLPISLVDDDKNLLIRKKRTHQDAIKEIDVSGEIKRIKFDSLDHLRKVRAAKMTESMSFEKYKAYHKARCVSFRGYSFNKGFKKMEKWLNPTKEFKITQEGLEVLSFLAYETVGAIVDGVILIRQDSKRKCGDPSSKFEGGFCNPQSLNNAVYIKTGYEGVPAITVAEVREALRRFSPPTTGMKGLFYRSMNTNSPAKYICL